MTRMTMPDPWSDDDPAVMLGRLAMTLRTPQESPQTPADDAPAPDGRRGLIAALVARIRDDHDMTAIETLKRLLK